MSASASPGPALAGKQSADPDEKAVELTLTGGDTTAIDVRVTTPLDPYPGTAARVVQAIPGIAGLAPGLHPTTALSIA